MKLKKIFFVTLLSAHVTLAIQLSSSKNIDIHKKTLLKKLDSHFIYSTWSSAINFIYANCTRHNCLMSEKIENLGKKNTKATDQCLMKVDGSLNTLDKVRMILLREDRTIIFVHHEATTRNDGNARIYILNFLNMDDCDVLTIEEIFNVSLIDVYPVKKNDFIIFYSSADSSDKCFNVICAKYFFDTSSTQYQLDIYNVYSDTVFWKPSNILDLYFSWKLELYDFSYSFIQVLKIDFTTKMIYYALNKISNKNYEPILMLKSREPIATSNAQNVLGACDIMRSTSVINCRKFDKGEMINNSNFTLNLDEFSLTLKTDLIVVHNLKDGMLIMLIHRIEKYNEWKIDNFTIVKVETKRRFRAEMIGTEKLENFKCGKQIGIQNWTSSIPTINVIDSIKQKSGKCFKIFCSRFHSKKKKNEIKFIIKCLSFNLKSKVKPLKVPVIPEFAQVSTISFKELPINSINVADNRGSSLDFSLLLLLAMMILIFFSVHFHRLSKYLI